MGDYSRAEFRFPSTFFKAHEAEITAFMRSEGFKLVDEVKEVVFVDGMSRGGGYQTGAALLSGTLDFTRCPDCRIFQSYAGCDGSYDGGRVIYEPDASRPGHLLSIETANEEGAILVAFDLSAGDAEADSLAIARRFAQANDRYDAACGFAVHTRALGSWQRASTAVPPMGRELLVRGFVHGKPDDGFWHKVMYWNGEHWTEEDPSDDEEGEARWKGYPVIDWRELPP